MSPRVPGGTHVRIGIHAGTAQHRAGNWFGATVNTAARLMSIAHGDQVIVSDPVRAALSEAKTIDLGRHRLRDLAGTFPVWQVVADGLPASFPAIRSMGEFVTTLPVQQSSLVGGEHVVSLVRSELHHHRLVTVLGAGGAGKTRVAIEAAGRELAHAPDGVFFADLTHARSSAEVAGTVLGSCRLTAEPEQPPTDRLIEHFADRNALIVVDNCEHVIDGVADLLDVVLASAPAVRVLATSRERIDIEGERSVAIPPLAEQLRNQQRSGAEASLCAPPAVLLVDADVDERGATLAALTRSRFEHESTAPLLLAFGMLALERDDRDRARVLADAAELYDSSTQIALIHLVSRVDDWDDDHWDDRRSALIVAALGRSDLPGSLAVLTAEAARW